MFAREGDIFAVSSCVLQLQPRRAKLDQHFSFKYVAFALASINDRIFIEILEATCAVKSFLFLLSTTAWEKNVQVKI